MFVSGIGTAAPSTRWTQMQCWDALVASDYLPTLSQRSQAILRKVLRGNNGICTRALAFDHLSEAFDFDPDVLDARFAKHAPLVASEAAARAVRAAGVSVRDVDAVIISTCTGYLCPGLTSYVTERLGLPTDILALDLVGQGCGAALPNLRARARLIAGLGAYGPDGRGVPTAILALDRGGQGCGAALPNMGAGEALIAGGRATCVLSICVEICSAAMYLDDDPGVLISAL